MEIACIVEGIGEQGAVPVLVRRIIQEIDAELYVDVSVAVVLKGRDKFRRRADLTRAVQTAARRMRQTGAILIVLDADDDCPADLGPRLGAWARAARSDIPIAVVVAQREYEAWFLASADALRGYRDLAHDLQPPDDPESIRGAKEWLSRRMPPGKPYSPTTHQASFSAVMSLEQARDRAPSFGMLCRDVHRAASG